MKSQAGSHPRSCSLDRTRLLQRSRPRVKPEIESALAVYEAKLQELMAASEVLQQQIIRWQSGLAEWKAWLHSTRQQQAMALAPIERSTVSTVARGRSRQMVDVPSHDCDAAARRYHLAEATKCLTTTGAGDELPTSSDEENKPRSKYGRNTTKNRVSKDPPQSNDDHGKYLTRTLSSEDKAPIKNQTTASQRVRPPVPKLGLSKAITKPCSWLSGEATQGDTYNKNDDDDDDSSSSRDSCADT